MTKTPTDSLMDVIRIRRSVRTYVDRPIPENVYESLTTVVRSAAAAWGITNARIIIVRKPDGVKRLRRAVFSGLAGKINPWILTTRAQAFIIACGSPDPSAPTGDRALYMAGASMLMEVAVLTAAEYGLGTCWLGGFGEEGVRQALSVTDDLRVVAVSPLGYPAERIQAESEQYMRENKVSLRRKHIDELMTMVEGT
ncbi:MAG: nitroreductase family protein [Deltaproteobacteria bacterium]|nr:nitroreductase family protein [Candidatus Zymogenaceae bacterium]